MLRFDPGGGVLIVLHGHGDDPGSARRWGKELAPLGWEVVAPGAPTRGSGADATRSWFSNGPRGAVPSEVAESAARIADIVDRVRRGGRRVAIAGFSQGGALALVLDRFGVVADATVAMCAFLPELPESTEPSPSAEPAPTTEPTELPPVLVLSAASDDDVPSFMGEDAAATLTAEGRTVDSRVVPGTHAVSSTMVRSARDWLTEHFASGVRISLGLPVDRVEAGTELVSGPAIAELAAAYEALGFHAAYVTDHPAPDARWLAAGGHHALEPTVALTAAAMVTRRIRLHTNVYVMPYRNPLLAAKALASLDVVSGGRLILGVAAGYLKPEFAALGADFERRGAALDEALEVLPQVWSTESYEGRGSGWSARSVTALPTPLQRPGPPIWVGGNSTAALRRAVSSAQGWSPFPTPEHMAAGLGTAAIPDIDALGERLEHAKERCVREGRTEPLTICFVPFSLPAYLADPVDGLGPLVDEVAQLAAMGVDWVALMAPGSTRAAVIDSATALSNGLRLS